MNFNATFIGQMVAFAIFIYLTYRYVWPPIVAAMAERSKRIADGLQAADRAEKDLELAQKKVVEQLTSAKKEAAAIIDQANKRAIEIVEEAKLKAQQEAERVKASAQAEIELATSRAKEELRSKVVVLALAGAEKILESSIDQNAHNELVNKLAAEL
ncbi:F0F1 ATP synthase subunit B [Cellvibrio japonicus]|uniref:ATP synthase subunit b n=1 Tax=Cellvibrio japonicus (strain Ueda107) TaxID=498211 RepID=ATPF_CELJU|nr:F0F1 ATP synthase subunit B [Cellvibrio japonicus]B3PIT1.1 RecName: Full=ATP synthase subunit b; AltName: Full=ATP synthase F(0) sector subunit b; AltName: Full=ATPase subunit I; AltName: Full=F-type ATPase subunit b; Short=F-ATPase subunit b [Cellvibrio japonicus Ueda107]ACE86127.1 ATP synthase F0, B subunit [Cellvibrio japonicus Ueda107]QEI13993.1 F0F1 ATP synthase subunit B [Cellvibrio japonicus]QEI17567.1 F0F1 ATP synthase subunit B [Cellvibrio japonicus]QEI21143.1 F0F1 ATP synthase sub